MARTKEQVVPDLVIGLSTSGDPVPAILLSDLRTAVGESEFKEYLGAEYPADYLRDTPTDIQLMKDGSHKVKHKLVYVQRDKLLARLTRADAKPAPARPTA